MSETTLMFNGQSIPVSIKRNDMAKVEQVNFLNVPLLRKAIGPIHFISLNRIYNFDINLYVSSENFTFTKDYNIKEKIKIFIERHVGTVHEVDKEDKVDNKFILFTIRGPDGTEHIFSIDILYLDIEDGFIIEVSKIQMSMAQGLTTQVSTRQETTAQGLTRQETTAQGLTRQETTTQVSTRQETTTQEQNQYEQIYDEFVSNFMKEFKPKNQPLAIGLETF
jgi:hypothetical protein